MLPLTERRAPARCAGFDATSRRALERAGLRHRGDPPPRALLRASRSPCALQLRALGIADDVPPTVTGGMPFAGGPLNHFSLQALTKLAERLRADAGGHGYLSAVSGILTKQGASVWSSAEPERPFAFDDVSDDTQRETPSIECVETRGRRRRDRCVHRALRQERPDEDRAARRSRRRPAHAGARSGCVARRDGAARRTLRPRTARRGRSRDAALIRSQRAARRDRSFALTPCDSAHSLPPWPRPRRERSPYSPTPLCCWRDSRSAGT